VETYWDNRTHFYGWLTFGAVAATIAVLMTRAPDRRQFAAAEDQYFVENQPGLAPRSPDQAVPLPANDRGNPSTMPLSQIVPEAPAPQTAPVPVAPAPVSGTGSLAAAEIANASFDLVEGNPEILLLMIRTANTALAEAKARFDAGLVSGQELQYLHLKLDLLQSRLAGNRIAFARVAHAAAEQRFTEAKTKYDFGVATQRTLDEVRSEMDISAIRLREAEARTAPVAEWGWTEPNATAFEPVVERTLGNIATGSAPELINFETGAVLYHRDILGTNLAGMTPEKTAEQFRTRGIDATGTLDSSTRGLAIWGGPGGADTRRRLGHSSRRPIEAGFRRPESWQLQRHGRNRPLARHLCVHDPHGPARPPADRRILRSAQRGQDPVQAAEEGKSAVSPPRARIEPGELRSPETIRVNLRNPRFKRIVIAVGSSSRPYPSIIHSESV
jgi:hypothetical protein